MDTSDMQLRESYLKHPDGDKLPCILAGNCVIPIGDIFEGTAYVTHQAFRRIWMKPNWGVIPFEMIPDSFEITKGNLFEIRGQLKASLFNTETGERVCPFFVTSV